MSDPVFSVIAPAARPENYKECYNSFSKGSDISFEMVFVGPKPPTEFVGEHFRYIYSTVKPVQCTEIGAREAKGQYIIPVSDDIKYSDQFSNKLYQEISSLDTNKYILSFMAFGEKKIDKNFNNYQPETYSKRILNSIKIGSSGCFPRNLWIRLGGIDSRFIQAYFDYDLHMRCYEIGLQFRLAKDIYIREFVPKFGKNEKERKEWRLKRLHHKYRGYSRTLLDSFWLNQDMTISKKRLLPVEPFEDKDIMTITQGEKGEWL